MLATEPDPSEVIRRFFSVPGLDPSEFDAALPVRTLHTGDLIDVPEGGGVVVLRGSVRLIRQRGGSFEPLFRVPGGAVLPGWDDSSLTLHAAAPTDIRVLPESEFADRKEAIEILRLQCRFLIALRSAAPEFRTRSTSDLVRVFETNGPETHLANGEKPRTESRPGGVVLSGELVGSENRKFGPGRLVRAEDLDGLSARGPVRWIPLAESDWPLPAESVTVPEPNREPTVPVTTSSAPATDPGKQTAVHTLPIAETEPSPVAEEFGTGSDHDGAAVTGRMSFWDRLRFPFLPQHEPADCGAACLAMVSTHHGRRFGVSQIRDLAGVTASGASLAQLQLAGESLGLEGTVWKLSADRVDHLKRPSILFWDGRHFVVFLGADGNRIDIADPGIGKLTLSREEFAKHFSGYALELAPGKSTPTLIERPTAAARFRSLLWQRRGTLGVILGLSLLLNLLGLAPAIFTQQILDRLRPGRDINIVHWFALGLVIVSLVEILTTWVRGRISVRFGQSLDRELLAEFFRHLLSLPTRFFRLRRTGDLLSRFEDNAQVRDLFATVTLTTLLDALMVIVYFGLMFAWNVTLAAAVLAFVPIYIGFTLIVSPIMKRKMRRELEDSAAQEGQVIETLSSIETVKALAVEPALHSRWRTLFERSLRTQRESADLDQTVTAAGAAIEVASTVTLLWVGAVLVLQGGLTVGEYMAFSILAGQVTGPLSRLIGIWDDIQQARVSLERLTDVLGADPESSPIEDYGHRSDMRGEVRLEGVGFRYGRTLAPVFRELNLTVPAGCRLAVVGRSGVGKTTLARLLLGLEEPSEGRITVDGVAVPDWDREAYRRQIGVVLQDSKIFSGTLLENITLGDETPDRDRAVTACRTAGAWEFIERLPAGLETVIGEVGYALSGGQTQRLCIARALYRDPRVLILDEATSALDSHTEEDVRRRLEGAFRGRTVITIAHRLRTVREADQIIVLDAGRIVERGTHDELVRLGGLYEHLVAKQIDG